MLLKMVKYVLHYSSCFLLLPVSVRVHASLFWMCSSIFGASSQGHASADTFRSIRRWMHRGCRGLNDGMELCGRIGNRECFFHDKPVFKRSALQRRHDAHSRCEQHGCKTSAMTAENLVHLCRRQRHSREVCSGGGCNGLHTSVRVQWHVC